MMNTAAQGTDTSTSRPPIRIRELEGLTILSARLIIGEDGKDALVLDGDDGTSVVVNVRQEAGEDPFLEVSGENVLKDMAFSHDD
ncbi:MAG: hypothetical protein JWM03_1927 [Rhodocyclales bacterium]|nr:hypothetical protein [Rhodocyclales bacterium]MDB5889055.1 hypothetical protein [Rhodocyclales bacterium]